MPVLERGAVVVVGVVGIGGRRRRIDPSAVAAVEVLYPHQFVHLKMSEWCTNPIIVVPCEHLMPLLDYLSDGLIA